MAKREKKPRPESRSAPIRIDHAVRQISSALAESFGGFDALRLKLEALDDSGRVLLEKLVRRPPAFDKVKR